MSPGFAKALSSHVAALERLGRDPLEFSLQKLKEHDLLIFDDGLHTASDPFDFYQRLIRSSQFQQLSPKIFLEVIPVNRQPAIDAYLSTKPEQPRLLYPAFQDQFGWPYTSYFDLLHTIYEVNQSLPVGKKIEVIAVSTPAMWGEIKTAQDWNIFVETNHIARDYHMYGMIRDALDDFSSGRKGIFLTNTRHAYLRLKRKDQTPVWSTAAFFNNWHPGKAYSIRFNAPALLVEAPRDLSGQVRSAAGMEEYKFRWARTAKGLWDEAFRANGSRPVAISLADTVFGGAPYIGNLMLSVAPSQTMQDANDAIIFLRDIETLRQTALTSEIYTPAFKRELMRRYKITRSTDQLSEELRQNGVRNLKQLIDKTYAAQPAGILEEAKGLGPIDEWRSP